MPIQPHPDKPVRGPGRPRRLRFPDVNPYYSRPGRLTGLRAYAYELATSRTEEEMPIHHEPA